MVIILLLVLAAAGAGWWWQHRAPPPVQWQGYAEADYVKVGPTQQGLLTTLAVRRGSKVAPGAALFDQDDTDDRAAKEQAARQLRQAEEQLANLQAGRQADRNPAGGSQSGGRRRRRATRSSPISSATRSW